MKIVMSALLMMREALKRVAKISRDPIQFAGDEVQVLFSRKYPILGAGRNVMFASALILVLSMCAHSSICAGSS